MATQSAILSSSGRKCREGVVSPYLAMSEEEGLVSARRSNPPPNLRELAAVLFRHPWLMATCFLLVFAAVIGYALVTPRYEAHFKVLLRRGRTNPVVSPQERTASDFARNEITEEELNSEVEVLRDEDLLRQVAAKAGLVEGKGEAERAASLEKRVRRLTRRLSVEPLRKSNMVQVRYRATNPEESARVLRILSEAYVQKHTELQRPSGEYRFFEQQTSEYALRLHQAEDQLVDFTRGRGVSAAAMERDIALQRLGDAEAEFRRIDTDRVETERRIVALRQQLSIYPQRSITQVRTADNPMLLEKLKTHLLELQLKRTELLTKFEPKYRLVQEVEQQIADTKQMIVAEGLTPVKEETTDKNPNYEWARLELERAQVQQDALQARHGQTSFQIAGLRRLAGQRQEDSVTQQDLARNARAEEESYFLYLRKREEARIGDALDEKHILNVAILQSPLAPALPVHSILFYCVVAFALSSIFSVGAAFAAEYLDPTLRTPDEVSNLLQMPVLAWLPKDYGSSEARSRMGGKAVVS